jgi:hypothetical protein
MGKILLLVIALLPLGGCATSKLGRTVTTGLATVGGAAGGAVIGTAVSGGNPIGTAVGAAGGGALAYGAATGGAAIAEGMEKRQKETAYKEGEAAATKEFYACLQDMQKPSDEAENGTITNYEVVIPGGKAADGTRLVPQTISIPLSD